MGFSFQNIRKFRASRTAYTLGYASTHVFGKKLFAATDL